MKKILLFALTLAVLASCATNPSATEKIGVSREEISFPIGDKIPNPAFTGDAFLKNLIALDSIFNFPQTNVVTFSPGSHSAWHRHGGMVVVVTDGVGLYQEEGKPAQILRKGDVLQIPAGVRHWHGATKDNWFSQMVIYDMMWNSTENHANEDNTVSDEYYANLEMVEFDHPVKNDSTLMFAAPAETIQLPTFNGPIRLANTVPNNNVAGGPGLHYVVFEPGVINAWHTHPGGQILIATDGIGYHQIEGQPVEVLHPGDVALCPPGVKHWHGGSAGTRFAHLAAGTNPGMPPVKWTDQYLSKEEYDKLPIPPHGDK